MLRHCSSLGCLTLALCAACAASPAREGKSPPVVHVAEPETGASDEDVAPPAAEPVATVEECEADDSEPARERFAEGYARGRSALLDNRFAEALEGFRDAYRATCNHHALFAVGIALEKLDDFDGAAGVFRQYAATAESEIGQRRARSYLDCIEKRRRAPGAIDCLAEQRANPTP